MNSSPTPSAKADEHPEIAAANSRAGLALFFIYLAFYAGFVGLAAFAPNAMAAPAVAGVKLAIRYGLGLIFVAFAPDAMAAPAAGVNLAICYGLGLIFAAFVVAALYMAACAHNARRFNPSASEDRRR